MKAMFLTQLQKAAVIAALFLVAAGVGTLLAHAPAQTGLDPAPSRLLAATVAPPVAPKPVPPPVPPPAASSGLAWDADQREYKAGAGEMSVPFKFSFTNVSASEIVINRIQPSCGCTVMKKCPTLPHRLVPGASDQFEVAMNLAGKSGTLVKAIVVDTSAGVKTLLLRVEIPPASATNAFPVPRADAAPTDAQRAANMQAAAADRQAIFKGDCARCHVEPATGKEGRELYAASCGICHDAEHRASMVPELKALPHPTSSEFWMALIADGKPGTLMPAFSQRNGGNLTDAQIASLAQYLVQNIPANPAPTKSASAK